MRRYLFILFLIGLTGLTSCLRNELQTGLTEQEAQEIIVLLKDHGIDAIKSLVVRDQEESWTVSVRGGDQNLFLAWRVLQENGLPRSHTQGLSEVFADTGLIPTSSQEKARLIVGLSGELSKTLEALPGVIDARVHVVLPENSPLTEVSQRNPTTASVLVKYQGDQLPLSENEVKALVANGVEGLAFSNVAVVYKQITPTPINQSDLGWSMGNQEFAFLFLVLLAAAALGAIVLLVANRRQRSQIQVLRKQMVAREQKQLAE